MKNYLKNGGWSLSLRRQQQLGGQGLKEGVNRAVVTTTFQLKHCYI